MLDSIFPAFYLTSMGVLSTSMMIPLFKVNSSSYSSTVECLSSVVAIGDIRELAKTQISDDHVAAFSDDCSAIAKRFNLFRVSTKPTLFE